MYKRLFDNDQWTEDGNKLEKELIEALKPIFDKYIQDGYSIRDMMSIVSQSTDTYLLREICKRMYKKD